MSGSERSVRTRESLCLDDGNPGPLTRVDAFAAVRQPGDRHGRRRASHPPAPFVSTSGHRERDRSVAERDPGTR